MVAQAQDVAWILAWLLCRPNHSRKRDERGAANAFGSPGECSGTPVWDSSSGLGLTCHPTLATWVNRGCFGLACPGHTHSQVLHPQMLLQLWPSGQGDLPPPTEPPRPRNVTAPLALRAAGQTEPVGKRWPLPQGPGGSSTSQASPASSPAACGAGPEAGRCGRDLGCPALWPGLGFLLLFR